MNSLTRDNIVTSSDVLFQEVDVPEWGGSVRIVGLNAKDASVFSSNMVQIGMDGKPETMNLDNFMAKLLVMTLCDENNKPLFTIEEADLLGKKSAKVIKRLYEIAAELSGLGKDVAEKLRKN